MASLGLVSAAYLSETLRAGLQAVPKGQFEAAHAVGLSPWRLMSDVVLPQCRERCAFPAQASHAPRGWADIESNEPGANLFWPAGTGSGEPCKRAEFIAPLDRTGHCCTCNADRRFCHIDGYS